MLIYFLQRSYYRWSAPCHFSHPLQLLLGGLLIDAEADQLTLHPQLTTNPENVFQDCQKAVAIITVIAWRVLNLDVASDFMKSL
jgi:hypothetical protein